MARKSQHSVTKRLRERKKADKAEQKRARRADRKETEMNPADSSEPDRSALVDGEDQTS